MLCEEHTPTIDITSELGYDIEVLWLGFIANRYDGFAKMFRVGKDVTYTDAMIEYPSIDIGAGGLKRVEACPESNEKGNVRV